MIVVLRNRLVKIGNIDVIAPSSEAAQSMIVYKLLFYPIVFILSWSLNTFIDSAHSIRQLMSDYVESEEHYVLVHIIAYGLACLQGLFSSIIFFVNHPEILAELFCLKMPHYALPCSCNLLLNKTSQNEIRISPNVNSGSMVMTEKLGSETGTTVIFALDT